MLRQCRALTTGKSLLEPLTSTGRQWQIGINHLMLYELKILSHQENSDGQNNETSSQSLWFNNTALVPYPEPYPNTLSVTQTPAVGTGQNLPHRIRRCLSTSGLGVLSDKVMFLFSNTVVISSISKIPDVWSLLDHSSTSLEQRLVLTKFCFSNGWQQKDIYKTDSN